MTPSECASWVMLGPNRMEFEFENVCHANMRHYDRGLWDEMLTAVPNSTHLGVSYIKWLIDRPFYAFRDYISLQRMPESGEYLLHITGLDKFPANALFNFCIASRMPIECPQILEMWSKIMALGLDRTLAFLIAGMARPADTVTLESRLECFGPIHVGHWWYDMTADWRLVLSGSPVELSDPYKDYPAGCTPCNRIWGWNDADVTYNLFDLTLAEIKEHFSK